MKHDTCPDGPFEVEVKLHITDGFGTTGVITYTLAPGKYPDAEAIKHAQKESKAAIPEGFRFMDRHEFIEEQLGLKGFAIPGPKDFIS